MSLRPEELKMRFSEHFKSAVLEEGAVLSYFPVMASFSAAARVYVAMWHTRLGNCSG